MRLGRLHVTGASGAGVTALGTALAEHLGVAHLDTDDFYWMPSDPPFQRKRPVPARLGLLDEAMARHPRWVLAGSITGWGDPLLARIDAVLFVHTPVALRLERLRRRERERFGAAIDPGGPMHDHHRAFLEWAAAYDSGSREGRSLPRHEAWLAAASCPVVRLDGRKPIGLLVEEASTALGAAG